MSDVRSRLLGAWTLVDYTTTGLGEGQIHRPLGRGASGVLMYSGDGYMSVQIAAAGRAWYLSEELHGGTDAERARAAAGYLGYAGRFEVDADAIVTHLADVSLFPNWSERPILRRATFREDVLTLGTVQPITIDGVPRTGSLTWKRTIPSSAVEVI